MFRVFDVSQCVEHAQITSRVCCSNGTLWNALEEPDIINTTEFEELFSKASVQPKKKPLSDTYEKKNKPKKVCWSSHTERLLFGQKIKGWTIRRTETCQSHMLTENPVYLKNISRK